MYKYIRIIYIYICIYIYIYIDGLSYLSIKGGEVHLTQLQYIPYNVRLVCPEGTVLGFRSLVAQVWAPAAPTIVTTVGGVATFIQIRDMFFFN